MICVSVYILGKKGMDSIHDGNFLECPANCTVILWSAIQYVMDGMGVVRSMSGEESKLVSFRVVDGKIKNYVNARGV